MTDKHIMGYLSLGILVTVAAALLTAFLLADFDAPKERGVDITCEGEYRLFMWHDQFEVVYDPDCLKVVRI